MDVGLSRLQRVFEIRKSIQEKIKTPLIRNSFTNIESFPLDIKNVLEK